MNQAENATKKIQVTLCGVTREVTFRECNPGQWYAVDNRVLISKPGGKLWPESLRAWDRNGETRVSLGYGYVRLNSSGYTPRCFADDPRVADKSWSQHCSR